MSKHTPGPWTYEEEAYHMEQVFGPKGLIAKVVGDSAETCFNAHLIAAAPDLLESLRLLHDNLAEYQRLNNLSGYDNSDMKMARAAIAKAKGATP